MRSSIKALWEVIKDFYPHFPRMVILNIIWLACSLPLVTIPAAYGGLAYATRILVYDETEYNWKQFFSGFKKTFWWSWRWFLPNLIVVVILLINILFFQTEDKNFNLYVRAANIILLFLWCFLQTFTFPFLFEQKKPRMLMALRNSFAVLVHVPGIFIVACLFYWLVTPISTLLVIPALLMTVAFSMFVSVGMLRKAIEVMGARQVEEALE